MLCMAMLAASVAVVSSQAPIPGKVTDLGYLVTGEDTVPRLGEGVEIEVFGDFQCPDTRDTWDKVLSPLLEWLKEKQNKASIVYHPFPLPYHFNSFSVTMAAEAAIKMLSKDHNVDSQVAFERVATQVFKFQDGIQNNVTAGMTQPQIWEKVYWPIFQAAGLPASQEAQFLSQRTNEKLDQFIRIPWKFGCSIGVTGTPVFVVNRVISDAAASWTLSQWQQFILSHS